MKRAVQPVEKARSGIKPKRAFGEERRKSQKMRWLFADGTIPCMPSYTGHPPPSPHNPARHGEKARGKVIVDNPITGIHLPEVQPIDRRVLTPEEMGIFIKEILKERLRVVMFISLFTGIRLGEVLPLQWADVNEKKRTLWIHRDIERVLLFDDPSGRKTELIVQETPKSKNSHRRVPLPEEIFGMLMLHKKVQEYEKKPNPENLVFPSKRGTYTDPRTYQKRVNVVCKRCELQGVNVHALRHTFATRLMEQNVPIRIIQSLLGHASIVTTEKYSHALDEEKVKAVNRLSEYFPGED